VTLAKGDILLGPPELAARAAVDEGWFLDEEDTRMFGFGRGGSGKMRATEFLRDTLLAQGGDDFEMVGIYLGTKPVGMLWVKTYPEVMRSVKIHPFIAKDQRGNGVFSEAMATAIDSAFSSGVYRIEMEPFRINKPIIGALRKMGFKQEGIKRSAYWMDNNDYDTVMLRMLRREWTKLREKEN